jgi:isocitrate/isopropylmalate dehydrogenase
VLTSVAHYKIAEIGGDGIGPDVRRAFEACPARASRLGSSASKVTCVDKAQEPGARTPDIGGNATTRAAGEAVIRAL